MLKPLQQCSGFFTVPYLLINFKGYNEQKYFSRKYASIQY